MASHVKPSQSGFTLIELSIVLVIIGLIVGGILVGQDLIRAAEIRATVSQIEKFNTSSNTFRDKYRYLPGDMPSVLATRFGFFATTGGIANTRGFGDGNGLIEGGGAFSLGAIGETLIYWRHLTDAQMIDGNYGTAVAGNALVAVSGEMSSAVSAGTAVQIFPTAKIGRGAHYVIYSIQGYNALEITGIIDIATDGAIGSGGAGLTYPLTPREAQDIDGKIDDGFPLAGNTRALRFDEDFNAYASAGDGCVAVGNSYDIGTANGNTPNCQMEIRLK